MRKIISLFGILILLSGTIVFTSAVPLGKNSIEPHQKMPVDIERGMLQGKKLSAIATGLKGSKLTLKEKIALKLFGKKIKNKSGTTAPAAPGNRSQLVAIILCLLPLIIFISGLHRFYLGYTWQGVAQIITMGGCGIWWLIDLIRLITGHLKPREGDYE